MPILGIQPGRAKSGLFSYDYGISEALGSLGSRLFGAPNQAVLQGGAAFYNPPKPQVLGTSTQAAAVPTTSSAAYGPTYNPSATQRTTSAPTGGGNSAAPVAPAGSNTLNNNVQQQLEGGLSNVDSDYNSYISTLDTQQGNFQRSAGEATSAIDTNANAARTALTSEQAKANQSYDTQAQSATKQASTSLQQARDLYRQLQQQNIAQLSGSGISSSSVAEALAENLGLETARRIAGVTGSRDEVLGNIAKERTNTENYVRQRMSDLETQVAQQKSAIQTQLLNQIDQINNARNVASNDRASKRQELILNAQSAIAGLQSKAQEFAQSLEQWKVQNQAKLSQTAVSFDDLSKAMEAARQFQGLGLGQQPQGQVDNQAAYFINPQQKQQEDLLNQYLPESLIGGQ